MIVFYIELNFNIIIIYYYYDYYLCYRGPIYVVCIYVEY